MIEDRRIAIDGQPIETPATLVTSLHGVTVDGKPVQAPAPARLFLYHKPTGLITAERDPAGRPTIYDRLPRELPRVIPVGRLDLNTEGLLLLTTDGELKRQLELPSTKVERSYRARTFGDISQETLETLIEGVEIEGMRYGAIDANLERRTGRNQWIEMRLTEGKNREVRRVLEYLGLQVSRLIRTAYGPFALADLPVGAVVEVRQHDLVAFRKELASGGGRTAAPSRAETRERRPRQASAGESDSRERRPRERPATDRQPPRSAERPKRQRPTGDRPPRAGTPAERPSRGRPAGERPSASHGFREERPTGQRTTSARSGTERTARERPTGRGSAERSFENGRPTRSRPGGERVARERSFGERGSEGRQERTARARPGAGRPIRERGAGDRGSRPPRSEAGPRGDAPKRPGSSPRGRPGAPGSGPKRPGGSRPSGPRGGRRS